MGAWQHRDQINAHELIGAFCTPHFRPEISEFTLLCNIKSGGCLHVPRIRRTEVLSTEYSESIDMYTIRARRCSASQRRVADCVPEISRNRNLIGNRGPRCRQNPTYSPPYRPPTSGQGQLLTATFRTPQIRKSEASKIPAHKDVMEPESKSTSEAADWVVDRLGLGTNDRQPTSSQVYSCMEVDLSR